MSKERKRNIARWFRAMIAVGATAAVAATWRSPDAAAPSRKAPRRSDPRRAGTARRSGRPTRAASTEPDARAQGGLRERPGHARREPVGALQAGEGPVEDRLHRVRDHQPLQPARAGRPEVAVRQGEGEGPRDRLARHNIPATIAASTPEQEIAAVQQMVRQGVNAIVMEPIAGAPVVPAIDAAGKAGVPVILTDIPLPQAKYGVVVWSQNQTEADAGALGLIQKGSVLMVRGLAGNPNDVVLYNQKIADLKYCPNIKVAASIYGDWDNGSAKTAVSQYLAAHPRASTGVLQDGGMTAGTIEAFQAAGKQVPPSPTASATPATCRGGWRTSRPTRRSAGASTATRARTCSSTRRCASWRATVRSTRPSRSPPRRDERELAKFAVPGLPLTSPNELGGPITAWCTDTCLNAYFNKPGTPGGL